jgi:shikimate dehydrogenase
MMKLAVLGAPITHSLSPKIHSAAYRLLGVDAQYDRFEVSSSSFFDFMSDHLPDEWKGFSLTMPLKELSLNICTEVEESARKISAINTLVSSSNGWIGYNTDISGFIYLLKQYESMQGELENIAILGGGGTAKAALSALDSLGATAKIYRRDGKRDPALRASSAGVEIVDWQKMEEAFTSSLLINTLPSSAFDTSEILRIPKGKVIDSLYYPWPTPLMTLADDQVIYTGKDLLVSQALYQIELFTGLTFDKSDFFSKLRQLI